MARPTTDDRATIRRYDTSTVRSTASIVPISVPGTLCLWWRCYLSTPSYELRRLFEHDSFGFDVPPLTKTILITVERHGPKTWWAYDRFGYGTSPRLSNDPTKDLEESRKILPRDGCDDGDANLQKILRKTWKKAKSRKSKSYQKDFVMTAMQIFRRGS